MAGGAGASLWVARCRDVGPAPLAAPTYAGGFHDRPQRARLPAALAALLLALLRPETSTCSTTTAPTARPAAAGLSASRSSMTESTSPGWSRRFPSSSASCSSATTSSFSRDTDEISLRSGMGRPRRLYRAVRRGVRQPARIRGPPPARSRAAARPGPPGPRPARLLVRPRRLRQAGACDRADGLGRGLARERRRSSQLRSRPSPDPSASHGLRGSAAPVSSSAPGGAGTSATSRRLGRLQPGRRGRRVRALVLRARPASRARGSRWCSSAIPSAGGACLSRVRRLAGASRAAAPTGPRSRPPPRRRRALAAGGDERGGRAQIAALGPRGLAAAEISGDLHADQPWREYAGPRLARVRHLRALTEGRRFDLVICEQVLEHVPDPWAAVENLRELCVPGGRVIVSTPFLIKVHEFPALRDARLLALHAARAPDPARARRARGRRVGSWGNRECVVGNFS